ncbi:MAG: DinB family protein [Bacteroidota bacterium]
MQKQNLVVYSNIHFIQQGIDLLSQIDEGQYTKNGGEFYNSGVGKHFRHIIEHYQSLLSRTGDDVNYDERARNTLIETDKTTAIDVMSGLVEQLREMMSEPGVIDNIIRVKSNEGVGEEGSPWSQSSIRRELQFLISHTVHHYALIAFILKSEGVNPDASFGVAPSTLKFEHERAVPAT